MADTTHRLKVAWLCTYSNPEKRSRLKLWRPSSCEYGQWIPNLLKAFEPDESLDLHVVSTDNFLAKARQSWSARNITYHCFQSGIPMVGRNWPARLPVDHLTRFWLNRRRIRKILGQIKPDVIHLFGVENPQYGAAVLDLVGRVPVLVTIQGFVHREAHYHDTLMTRVRCRYEEALLRACHAFSGDYDSEKVVRGFNADVSYRHLYFPVNEELISRTPASEEQPYDVLFVGGLSRQKGFEDFLGIVGALAAERPAFKAAVVGHPEEYPPAAEIISRSGCGEAICWLGRFPSQAELFNVFRRAKLFLAPTYNDAFPSTVRESMLLGTAVIAYATGGIPWANRDGCENVALVPQGDVRQMTERARLLLDDVRTRRALAERARAFAEREFSLVANAAVIRRAYYELAEKK